MNSIVFSNINIKENEGVFTFKNKNTKLELVIKLLQLLKNKTNKEFLLQEPISSLGLKFIHSINKWK